MLTRQEIQQPIDIGHSYGWEHRRLSLAAKELNWSQKRRCSTKYAVYNLNSLEALKIQVSSS
ncbi:hypothetical protein C5N92_00510 [Glaesserella australis]|uniref:Uncharacterized protein n=1 Tax=Glaesserella australis TaxID=2094024 RepID=A0A328C3T8_9PAST|nr:hypothetical protein CJD39_09735 [Glaesserella sp. 15-184]RAL19952.1 hypothetical protein C5N92_00510 [Glaesserella australis]